MALTKTEMYPDRDTLSNVASSGYITARDQSTLESGVTEGMLLKRGTGSGERGAGNGSLGTSCQRKPSQKSKMAVQKTRERKKKTKKGIRSCLG